VFTTERADRHQQAALSMAPEDLQVTMLREPDRARLVTALDGVRYLISERRGVIDDEVLTRAPDLEMILRLGATTHDIDLEAARRRGIVVCRRGQEGPIRVAEYLVMQCLALLRRLPETERIARDRSRKWAEPSETDENTFSYNWSETRNLLGLHDRRIGILGFGEIGAELSERLKGWRCDVTYHRRSRLPEPIERNMGVRYVELGDLASRSDVVICLLPYTKATLQMVDVAFLASMKPGAFLVSAGSGGVVDEFALADALFSGRLAGAAVDTFAVEPIQPDNPLLQAAEDGTNIILTPHVAGGSPPDAWDELRRMFGPVMAHRAGEEPSGRLV
tara:strand:+ start:3720 stop:4721 length:1002 start_codon:yes stop_codon:yes gene_type:complete